MKVIACLSRFATEWDDLKAVLEGLPAAVILHKSPAHLLQSLGSVDPDLYLVDSRSAREDHQMLMNLVSPAATILMVLPTAAGEASDSPDTPELQSVYDTLCLDERPAQQRRSILRALERSALLRSDYTPIRAMQASLPTARGQAIGEVENLPFGSGSNAATPSRTNDRSSERLWELALRSLSRTLSAGFDVRELIGPFLDLAVEISGVARAALLLPSTSEDHFKAVASRGLHSPMLGAYSHPKDYGLAAWLTREGRPLRREDPNMRHSPFAADISRSMDALQAAVCIPMASRGELLAILALGPRLNGQQPGDEQVEILYTIGTHVAAALQNILLHHEMERRQTGTESILEHMTNGIIAIDDNEKVIILNRRAGEILGRTSSSAVGQDLRLLPAPLGDYLYTALRTGEVRQREKLNLAGENLPIEISAYPVVLPEKGETVGSVLVVEDIRERIELEESHRHADRQETFNRLISQLAHELNNPMVAIKTFADLYPQKLDDQDFNQFVLGAVLPEISRLEEIVGKLVDFVNYNTLDMRTYSVEDLIQNLKERMQPEADRAHAILAVSISDRLPDLRCDPGLLTRALTYLVQCLLNSQARGAENNVKIDVSSILEPYPRVILNLNSSIPWIPAEDLDHLFDPMAVRKDQLNLSLPVARKIILEHRGELEAIPGDSGLVSLRVTLPAIRPAP